MPRQAFGANAGADFRRNLRGAARKSGKRFAGGGKCKMQNAKRKMQNAKRKMENSFPHFAF
jgi:hypothetical protein